MSKLESTQYDAVLVVSGAWRGTRTDKVLEELALTWRRWYGRLFQFYKIVNNSCPEYLRTYLPEPRENHYHLRRSDIFSEVRAKTNRYSGPVLTWSQGQLIAPGQFNDPGVNFASVHGLTPVTFHMSFSLPPGNFERRVTRCTTPGNLPCRGNFSPCEQKVAGGRVVLHMLIFMFGINFPIKVPKDTRNK